jgi:hypothetical protein
MAVAIPINLAVLLPQHQHRLAATSLAGLDAAAGKLSVFQNLIGSLDVNGQPIPAFSARSRSRLRHRGAAVASAATAAESAPFLAGTGTKPSSLTERPEDLNR